MRIAKAKYTGITYNRAWIYANE